MHVEMNATVEADRFAKWRIFGIADRKNVAKRIVHASGRAECATRRANHLLAVQHNLAIVVADDNEPMARILVEPLLEPAGVPGCIKVVVRIQKDDAVDTSGNLLSRF